MGELVAVLNEHAELEQEDARSQLATAWATAALHRSKRLPPLKRLMTKETPADVQAEIEKARRDHEDLMAQERAKAPPGYDVHEGLLVPRER